MREPDSVGDWWISYLEIPHHVTVWMEALHMCMRISTAPVFQIMLVYFLSSLCIKVFHHNVLVDVYMFFAVFVCSFYLYMNGVCNKNYVFSF